MKQNQQIYQTKQQQQRLNNFHQNKQERQKIQLQQYSIHIMAFILSVGFFILSTSYNIKDMKYWALITLALVSEVKSKVAINFADFDGDRDFYKCAKEQGYNEIIIQCQQDGANEIYAAKKEGLIVHGMYFPCRKDNPEAIARELRLSFGTNIMEKLWIATTTIDQDPLCDWGSDHYNPESNCEYLQSLVLALRKYNQTAHIVTDRALWKQTFFEDVACPDLSDKTLLWWIPDEDEDEQSGKPDFDLYNQIGGWQKPYMKMYEYMVPLCNQKVWKNYYE